MPTNRAPDPLANEERRHPKPWESGVTLDEGVTWLIGNEAGLDGRSVAGSGQAAQPVLKLLRAATQAPSQGQRARLASRTEAALKKLNPAENEALFAQVTARLAELTNSAPSVNPETGLQEFAEYTLTGPPMPGRKPDPDISDTERSRREMDAARLRARIGGNEASDDVQPYFPFSDKTFEGEGYDLASQSLGHFLGATGQTRFIDPEKLRQTATITEAENLNRDRFTNQTFGDWKPEPGKNGIPSTGELGKAKLDAIQDGETIKIRDEWHRDFSGIGNLYRGYVNQSEADKDLGLSLGSAKFVSDGDFNVKRNGNSLLVDGNITHSIDDKYDFYDVGGFGVPLAPDDQSAASRIQSSNYAQPYWNRSRWSQPMNAIVDILPDGKRKVRRIQWGNITPYDWSVST